MNDGYKDNSCSSSIVVASSSCRHVITAHSYCAMVKNTLKWFTNATQWIVHLHNIYSEYTICIKSNAPA